MRMSSGISALAACSMLAMGLALCAAPALAVAPGVQLEKLDRGLVAGPAKDGGVLISWRALAGDTKATSFDLYRGDKKLNRKPLRGLTSFRDEKGDPAKDLASYSLRPTGGGKSERALAATDGYLTIALSRPLGGTTPSGEAYEYNANDASVGDLDGDGQYEIVLKWDPSNSKDNAFGGYSGPVILDAYRLNGERLWRINLGPNIRAGAHYTQFIVYDMDGDGKAELALRTSDGTIDGTGTVLGDPKADHRGHEGEAPQGDRTGAVTTADGRRVAPLQGRIMKGPEFITVFEGTTGKALASAPYLPARHPQTNDPTPEQMQAVWGDGYANRSDRFLAGLAYLDGQRPSMLFARGYYTRSVVAAWDWRDGKLTSRWVFDSAQPDLKGYSGQGNHQMSIADVDNDGRDEVIYGAMAIDDDGKGLWNSGLLHGDALHVGDLDPTRPGLERFGAHESPTRNGGYGSAMLDARDGTFLWGTKAEKDTGRGIAIDIDPRYPGAEAWASNGDQLYNAKGEVIAPKRPRQMNFGIFWDGDAQRELLDRTSVSKWDWKTNESVTLLDAKDAASNNGTKANPAVSADILGDWREEVVLRSADNTQLRVYVTPYATDFSLPTLMHDRQYRVAIAWQNVAYNQPPHTSFDMATRLKAPAGK